MKLKNLTGAVKKILAYGIFMNSISPRFGGGWVGILSGGAIRGLVFAAPYALLLYVLSSWSLFKWAVSAFAFLLYSILLEIFLSRRARR